ncbi:MAG: DUF4402 domain-containing protein [Prolixibacteraceae bacterium]
MLFTKKIFITLTALTAISAVSFAQSNSAQAIATVEVVQPIAIARASDLNFGKIITGAGTMVVSVEGVRTQNGSITLLKGGSEAPATFTVTGRATATYAVTLPSSVVLKKSGGTDAEIITADTFTHNAIALSGNSDQLKVGATMHLLGQESVGVYNSELFAVTVAYN